MRAFYKSNKLEGIMRLKDKVAVVTGARRGIGRAIALEFAKEGAKVVVSDIELTECQAVCDEIRKLGSDAIAVKCDVTKKNEVDEMMEKAVRKFGKLDIMVNNAGVYVAKPVAQTTEKDWDFVVGINLKGVFLCSSAAAKHMMKQNGGKIISTASIAGKVGFADSSAYCASKGGIISMTKELAMELAPHHINVNAVAPGVIETNMTKGMTDDEKAKQGLLMSIPLGRIGKPEDIAKAVVFLASDESDYVTGHTLVVDGGWLTR
jgi:NAD(P)-dependent dehydrogenase (short-subunit alcohol dehydrogenase family)